MTENLFDPAASLAGQLVDGRYQLVERLGSGGMGKVYRATRIGIGRTVAVKFLRSSLANRDNFVRRFEREAVAMGRLYHVHCVTLIDYGVHDGVPYLVMDYVEGQPLNAAIAGKPMTAVRAVAIMRQLLSALSYLHRRSVIHRDIKGENVMLVDPGERDFVMLLDLGMAKMQSGVGADPDLSMQDGLVVGTPSAMPPEQIRGQPADERSDVYAAGVLLYTMVTGRKPLLGKTTAETIRMQLEVEPEPPREVVGRRALSAALERVILDALAKDPDERTESAAAMAAALAATPEARGAGEPSAEHIELAPPRPSHRRLVWLAAAGWGLAAALAAALIYVLATGSG